MSRRALRSDGDRPTVDVVVLVACLGLALLPLLPVYAQDAAVPPIVGGLALGAALATLAARLRWGAIVTVAASTVVYVVAGASLAAPDTALAGVLPTRESVVVLLDGAVTAWKQVLTLDPSLGTDGNVLVVPYLLALGGSVGAVSLALRARARRGGAWAALVPLGVLGLSVLLGTKEVVAPVGAGVLLAAILLVWIAWRRGSLAPRRGVALLAMAAVMATSGAVLGPLIADQRPRYVLRDELVPPFDPRDQASPLSAFRKFVKEWKDTDLLTVRGLPEGANVRLATMDAFDGVVWNVAGAETADGSGEFRRVGDSIRSSVEGQDATVEMQAIALPFVWLPTVGYTQSVTFEGPTAADLTADLRYNDATGTAVLTGGVPAGARWTADVVLPPVPDDDEIGAATVGRVRLPDPRGVPDAVPVFAGEIAGTATSPVLIARSLEAGLAERGWFSHGLTDSGQVPSLSGHGADRLTTLLTGELMVGDGEQYASAMALMAREMGLPARVVLGFEAPQDRVPADEITITGDDVRAWVEISFTGHGWVAFHPTPDETKTPRQDTPQEESEPQPQVMQPPPPPEEPVRPPDEDPEQPRTEDAPEEVPADQLWRTVALVSAGVGAPLVLLLGPLVVIAAAKRRRRRRRRTRGDGVGRVVGAWAELLDEAHDLGRPVAPQSTRREIAVGLSDAFVPLPGRHGGSGRPARRSATGAAPVGRPMAVLASNADEAVFGPGQPTPEQVESYWAQVDSTVHAMRTLVRRRERWRARWSTASLRAGRRARAPASAETGRRTGHTVRRLPR